MRKINKRKYVIVAIITLVVFLLGVSLGTILDYERYRFVREVNEEQDIVFNSLQLQYLYLSELDLEDEDACAAIYSSLEDSVKQLGSSLDNIINYEKSSRFNQDEYLTLKREYTLDNIRYWLFAEKAKEECGRDLVTVLYFFTDGCVECGTQGTYLTYYKKQYEDQLLVFPLDVGIQEHEGMLRILMQQYNITDVPSVVIGDNKFGELLQKEELGIAICDEFKDNETCLTT